MYIYIYCLQPRLFYNIANLFTNEAKTENK